MDLLLKKVETIHFPPKDSLKKEYKGEPDYFSLLVRTNKRFESIEGFALDNTDVLRNFIEEVYSAIKSSNLNSYYKPHSFQSKAYLKHDKKPIILEKDY